MHASIEQLLSLRDGAPCDAAVATHVERCQRCAGALARLREQRAALAALPPLAPPDAWPAIAGRLRQRPRRVAPIAAAAAFAVAVTGLAWVVGPGGDRPVQPGAAPPAPVAETAAARHAPPDARLDALMTRSAVLEQRLRDIRSLEPAVVRLGHGASAARLQAHLRALDAGRAQWAPRGAETDLERLYWNERVRLLDSMVDMERAERLQRAAGDYRGVPAAYRQ